jgi:XTP/dITP diphosphohydrolase
MVKWVNKKNREIVFATGNEHKIEELNAIIKTLKPFNPHLMHDNHPTCQPINPPIAQPHNSSTVQPFNPSTTRQPTFVLPPAGFAPDENGITFEENSYIKAKEAHRLTGLPALADDSGLCVEALGGAPGVHSARYADTAQGRIDKLLNELEPHSNRRAKFVCAMTLLDENGKIVAQTRGECHGEIALKQSGTNGFGYDPVFIVEGTGRTMAEMSEEEKNTISHRARALNNLLDGLNSLVRD